MFCRMHLIQQKQDSVGMKIGRGLGGNCGGGNLGGNNNTGLTIQGGGMSTSTSTGPGSQMAKSERIPTLTPIETGSSSDQSPFAESRDDLMQDVCGSPPVVVADDFLNDMICLTPDPDMNPNIADENKQIGGMGSLGISHDENAMS